MSLRVKQDRSDSRVLVIENAAGLVFKDHIIELVGGISLRIEPRETSAITGIVVDKGIIPLIVRLLNGYESDQARPSPVPALDPDQASDASDICFDDAKKLRDALDGLLSKTMKEFHASIWWQRHVENGGKPKWVDPPEWTAAKKALADTEYLA